jgi:hypothetical protein
MRHLEHDYEFVVIGGGLAGMLAAITAARAGLRVALVQDRPVLGGNASKEIRVPPVGAVNCNFAYCRETGLTEEIYLENLFRNPTGNHEGWDLALTGAVRAEKTLDCYLSTVVDQVEVNDAGDRLVAVSGYTLGSETRHTFRAPLFADCTGDGTVGALAGAPFRMGIEAQSEFGESMCGVQAQDNVMGCSMHMRARDAGRPVPFVKPDWVQLTIDEENFGPYRPLVRSFMAEKGGFWWLEWGGELDTVHDTEQIRDQVLQIVYGVWDYLKNRSPLNEDLITYELDWVGTIPGKRESRRIEGDHILSQVDIENQRPFDDTIAYGGWGFDDHPKEGFFSTVHPSFHVHHKGPYNIPLRSLYSRQVLNLLLAGRDISVTHFGLSSTRVMLTCCQIGEAVGMAAATCAAQSKLPRQVVQEGYVRDTQFALQRADHHIHALQYQDPENLAPLARVTASSTLASPVLEQPTGVVPLDQARLWQFPVGTPRLNAVSVLLDVDRDTRLTALLHQGAENGSTYPSGVLASRQVYVRAGRSQWVEIALDQEVAQPGWHFLEIAANPDVRVHWGEYPPVGVMGYGVRADDPIRPNPFSTWSQFGRNEQVRRAYCLRLSPTQPVYAPANVTNGWSRPTSVPNLWISAQTDFSRAEWLELRWDTAQTIETVDLLYDSALDFTFYQSWNGYGHNVMPSLVKEYRLLALDGADQWQEIVHVKGNYQRHRTHSIEPTQTRSLRLEILRTNGIGRAQVYSIRAYETQA